VGPRYLARRLSFYSLHVVDVGGGGAAAGQFGDRRMDHTAAFVAEGTWPTLGIPQATQVDNAFALARVRFINPFNLFVRTCLLFGVEVVRRWPAWDRDTAWQDCDGSRPRADRLLIRPT